MIPILFDASATEWTTFGLGALTDTISCEIEENRNGSYELEMKYPVTGAHYSEIANRQLILAKPNFTDSPQPFRIYQITKPLNGVVTIYAQHISYDLSGYVDGPFHAVGVQTAMIEMLSDANCYPTGCPFVFATDLSTIANMTVKEPTSVRALMGGIAGSLIDLYGGEWSYDGYVCHLNAHRGEDRGVTIRYGKNLTSIKQEENLAACYTGVYPYWADTENDELVTLPEKVVNCPGQYGYTRIMPLDLTDKWDNAPSESQLRVVAEAYIRNNDVGVPKVNITLDFIQADTIRERVDLCDTVTVYFDRLGISASAKCIRTRWDVLKDRYIEVELGSARNSIAGTIASIQKAADEAVQAASTFSATATAIASRITGNVGGYVVMHDTDEDGHPDEILIMDTDSIDTAVNVIRMNNGGIAFSESGYDGPYMTAWNIGGQFVADFIQSGTLAANMVKISGDNNFYWDAGNIYIKSPTDNAQQIRIGKYDGTHYGIGFTRDGGATWQTALDFNGLNVQATGFSKTYVSLTQPPGTDYNIGDIWVKAETRYMWQTVGEHTWNWAAEHTWDQLGGPTEPNMYTWNGVNWQLIYDGQSYTAFDTRLTIAENNINAAVASVAQKGVTYVQLTDPRNNEGITINIGDQWVKALPGYASYTWAQVAAMTWNELAAFSWDELVGPKCFVYDGFDWVLTSDRGAEVRHNTQILQTDRDIKLLANEQTAINGRIAENEASININARAITSEVTRARNSETTLGTRITQTAESVTAEATRAKGAETTLSGRISLAAEAITAEVSRAQGAENVLSGRITAAADSISTEVQNGLNGEGGYTSIYQTSNQVSAIVTKNAIQVFRQSAQPSSTTAHPLRDGDLWYDSGNNNKLKRYNGSSWVACDDTSKYEKYSGIIINEDGIDIRTQNGQQGSTSAITLDPDSGITIASGKKLRVNASDLIVATGKSLEDELDKTSNINEVYNQYYKSTSSVSPQGGSWQNTAPTWEDGKYVFMRTVTTYKDGSAASYSPSTNGTNISGAKGATGNPGQPGAKGDKGDKGDTGSPGSTGVGISSISEQYALAASSSVAPTSGWQSTMPAMTDATSGYYYWTRTDISYTNGTSASIFTCSSGTTYAAQQAYSARTMAQNIANGATAVPHVQSSGLEINGNDVNLLSSGSMHLLGNASIMIGTDGSNSAMVLDKNGIALASGGDIAVRGGRVDIDADSSFTVESDNFSLNADGVASMTGAQVNGSLKANGYDVISRYDLVVSSQPPVGHPGMIWIEPNSTTTTVVEETATNTFTLRESLKNVPRTVTLDGSGSQTSFPTYSYKLTVPIYIRRHTGDPAGGYLSCTVSDGTNSVSFTSALLSERNLIGDCFIEMTATSTAWLGGSSSLTLTITAIAENGYYVHNLLNSSDNSAEYALTCTASGAASGWQLATVHTYV